YESWLVSEVRNHPASLRAGSEWFLFLAAAGRTVEASVERERLAGLHPDHVQPTLLKLAFACPGPIPVASLSAADIAALRSAHVDKDSFHVYVGLRDGAVRRNCEHPDWSA